MKTYLGCYLIFVLGFIFESQAQVHSYSVCSGQNQKLEVTEYLPGSVFEWYVDNTKLNESSSILVVKEDTTTPLTLNYKCLQKKDGILYQTVSFTVKVNPFPIIDIIAGSLCEGKMASFTMSSPTGITEQTWTIGNSLFYSKAVDYLCDNSPIKINLLAKNLSGCATEIVRIFNTTAKPAATIEEIALTKNFIKGVYCGNSTSEFELAGLSGSFKLVKWNFSVNNLVRVSVSALTAGKIIPGDKSLFEWVLINGNKVKVKWVKTNSSSNVKLTAVTSNGTCEYETNLNTILISDNTPDLDSVYQKPNNSNVLIYPSGQFNTEIKYDWGYTDEAGKDIIYARNSKFYCEYDLLNTKNKYWVETWYPTNEVCRTRNLISKVTKSATISSIGIEMYPNPVREYLQLKLVNPVDGKIAITDLSGMVFKIVPVTTGTEMLTVSLGSITPGVYFISYKSDAGSLVITESFIKQ